MSLIIPIIELIAGFVLLTGGANWLISGGTSFALSMGLSRIIVGLTIVSYGTSLPELTVSLTSSLSGSSEMAFGNVLGSNIANIALILGLTSLIKPINVNKIFIKRDWFLLAILSFMMMIFAFNGVISRLEGSVLFLSGISYTVYLIKFSSKDEHNENNEQNDNHTFVFNIFLIILGIIGLTAGGHFVVEGAVFIAKKLGMSDRIIAITVISIGTSLPELASSLTATIKGKGDISIGNVLGSNMFNIMFVLGLTSLVRPLHIVVNKQTYTDAFVMLFLVLVLYPILKSKMKILRIEGLFLFVIYSVYLGWLLIM